MTTPAVAATAESLLDTQALDAALASPLGENLHIGVFRQALTRANELLKQRFLAGARAEDIVHLRAEVVDDIVRRVWCKCGLGNSPHTLLAVGGYGRGELHPYSDVDIAILLATPIDAEHQAKLESLVTFLWDIGLEVGHSVRTLDECVAAAAADITIMTNLMETRVLAGPHELHEQMRIRTAPDRMWPANEFFKAKVKEQDHRHQRYNDEFQQLEPNIKESPGGLRDIQIIDWVANRYFNSSGFDDLVDHGFLTENECHALESGRSLLWRIRCALHFTANQREDRLLFDHQISVAEVFGYSDAAHNRAVELFMKTYYRTVRDLSNLNDMLLGLFEEAILQKDRASRTTPLNRRFQVRNNYIEVSNDKVFSRTPTALLELFLLMQRNPSIRGVRASTIRLVRESLHLIDGKFRKDIRARSLFMEIIRQPRRIGHELQRMHRYGVLSAYLPAFARVEGLMQFDLFHVYTVDAHSLFVVLNMRFFSYPPTENDQTPLIRQVIERIPKLELLYIAGMFHDIGKGQNRDHSEAGAEAAGEFCTVHGLSNYDTNLVIWLVRNHLIMSATAQRKDIYDPEVVKTFAAAVGDQIRLDYLYLLTIADIRGTNPRLWTSWKDTLLSDLHIGTLRLLRGGAESPQDKLERLKETKVEALNQLDPSRFSEHGIALLWSTLGDEYFLRHRPYEIAWHTEVILEADGDDLPLIALRNFEHRGGTTLFIYAADMDYLFAISTAVLDRLRLDVQDARIITSEAGYILDSYVVLEADTRTTVTDPARFQEIQSRLRSAIRSGEIPEARSSYAVAKRLRNFSVPATVEFTEDHVHRRTIMGVIAIDRPGFLSIVGRAMQNCGVRLHDARIATFGERAEDYFYITDFDNRPVDSETTRACLRAAIVQALTP